MDSPPSLRLRYRRQAERVYVRIETDVPDESRVWRTLTMLGAPIEVDRDPRALSWGRYVKEGAFSKLQKAAQMMRAEFLPEPGEAPLASGRAGAAYRDARPVDVEALVKLGREDAEHALAALRAGRTELAVWAKDTPDFAIPAKKDLLALDEAIDLLKSREREAQKARERDSTRDLSAALRGVAAEDAWKATQELAALKARADKAAREPAPTAPLPDVIPGFRGKLRHYQEDGVRFLLARGLNAILADEMGLGKTVMTIAAVLAANERALVVGPANVLYNWADEIERFTDEVPLIYHERRFFGGRPDARFLLTTYDALRNLDPAAPEARRRPVLILDEAHYVRNPETQRAQIVKQLPQKKRILLTGTPLVNTIEDYYELLSQVDASRFHSRTDFRDQWTVDASLFNKYVAVRNLAADFLQRATRDVLLRRRKAEVLAELPERIISVSKHEMEPKDAKAYEQLAVKAEETLREGKSDVAVFAAIHALRHHLAVARVPAVLERVKELVDVGESVVVYSHYLEPLEKLHAGLGGDAAGAARLDGSTPPKRRKELADRLGKDVRVGDVAHDVADRTRPAGRVRVLLAQMEAGGIGLNFTGARYVIFVHFGWTPAVHAQAMDRVHRIGQDRTVFVEFFVTPETIDERIARLLLRKEADANLVLDEGTDLHNREAIAKLLGEARAEEKRGADAPDARALR